MTTGGPSTRDAVVSATARRHRRQTQARWWRFGLIALIVVVVDQISKLIIRAEMAPSETNRLFPGFSISRVSNQGIAFGLFPGRQAIVAVLTVVALSAIAIALAGLVARNLMVAVGAGLLVGGSLGNLIDRLVHGAVTDFIDLDRWPAFNLADCGITIGAVLIVLGLLRDADEVDDDTG